MDYEKEATIQLPDGMSQELAYLIDKAALTQTWDTKEDLATCVYKEVAKQDRDADVEDELTRLGVGTGTLLVDAVDSFLSWREENPDTVLYDLSESGDDDDGEGTGKITQISEIALFLIDNVVERLHITNRYDVMSHVCELLEYRFDDEEKLEQNLTRMNLTTTKDVLHVIDIYFVMKKLYPETIFGRKRMHSVWAPAFAACLAPNKETPKEEAS